MNRDPAKCAAMAVALLLALSALNGWRAWDSLEEPTPCVR